MIYNLKPEQVAELLSQPETGLGYQVVKARFAGQYAEQTLIALNADVLVTFDQNRFAEFNRLETSFNSQKEKAPYPDITSLQVLTNPQFSNILNEGSPDKTTGAIDNSPENANGTERFVRLSHWPNDKRVDTINRRLIPGSYSTTEKDYKECKKINDDPVERYALPNNNPIFWAYYILPVITDNFQRGIVQPAYSRRGGGEEAFFNFGTANGTYQNQTPY